jgi:hypothetical protein
MPLAKLAYGIVLAETTPEITVREEYRPGPAATHQRGFFSEMWAKAGNNRLSCRPAFAQFALVPIHAASARTETAILKD